MVRHLSPPHLPFFVLLEDFFAQASLHRDGSISQTEMQNNMSRRVGAKSHYGKEIPVRNSQAERRRDLSNEKRKWNMRINLI